MASSRYRFAVRSATATAAAAGSYLLVRVVEEQLPWEWLDKFVCSPSVAQMQQALFWQTTHPEGMSMPDHATVMRDNSSLTISKVGALLRRHAADFEGLPHDSAFNIEVQESEVDDVVAGKGCFISGSASRGSMLTFYHGVVYPPLIGRVALLIREMATIVKSEHVLCINDSYLLDGTVSQLNGTLSSRCSSAACGQICNHPTKGMQPNAMFYFARCDTNDYPADSVDALDRIVSRFMAPLTFNARRCMHIAALVALRDIADGEEIFVDYMFNDDHGGGKEMPAWYHAVVEEAA